MLGIGHYLDFRKASPSFEFIAIRNSCQTSKVMSNDGKYDAQSRAAPMKMKVLLVDNQFKVQTESRTKAVEDLVSNLQRIGVEVVHVKSIEDACGVARSTVWVHCVLLTRTLDEEHTASVNEEQVKFVDLVRARQRGLPVFLLCDRGRIGKVLNLELLQRINEPVSYTHLTLPTIYSV